MEPSLPPLGAGPIGMASALAWNIAGATAVATAIPTGVPVAAPDAPASCLAVCRVDFSDPDLPNPDFRGSDLPAAEVAAALGGAGEAPFPPAIAVAGADPRSPPAWLCPTASSVGFAGPADADFAFASLAPAAVPAVLGRSAPPAPVFAEWPRTCAKEALPETLPWPAWAPDGEEAAPRRPVGARSRGWRGALGDGPPPSAVRAVSPGAVPFGRRGGGAIVVVIVGAGLDKSGSVADEK